MSLTRTGGRQDVAIANGQTTSAAIDISRASLLSIIFPSALTSTTCTLTVSDTAAGTFVPLYDSTGVIVPAMTVGTTRSLDLPTALASHLFMKIVLGSAEGGARTLTLCTKG